MVPPNLPQHTAFNFLSFSLAQIGIREGSLWAEYLAFSSGVHCFALDHVLFAYTCLPSPGVFVVMHILVDRAW